MKTLQTITATIALTISTISLAETNSNADLRIQVLEIKLPSCNGAANGSISVEARGGKSPYTYNWNTYPEQSMPTAVNLQKGIYFIQVTDANGLVYFESVEVTDPIQTTINSSASMPEDNMTVKIESQNSNNVVCYLDGQRLTEPLIQGLDIGIHKLVITSNGCTVMQFIDVAELENKNETDELPLEAVTESTPLYSLENLEETNFNVDLSMVQHE